MPYKVKVKKFTDLEDKKRVYHKGDVYPADGAPEPSEKRIAQLTSRANKAHVQILEEVEVEEETNDLPAKSTLTVKDIEARLDKLDDVEYDKSANKDEKYKILEEAVKGGE